MSSRGYEKHVLQGAVAGLATGVVVGLVVLALAQHVGALVEDLARRQLSEVLPLEAVEEGVGRIRGVVEVLVRAAPALYAFQYALLGSLFGLVKGVLRIRLGWGEAASALAAGGLFALLLGAVPLVVLSALDPGLVDTISRYFDPYVAALSLGALFTVAIVLVSAVRGPWTGLFEARPREV